MTCEYFCHHEVFDKKKGRKECGNQLRPWGNEDKTKFYYCDSCHLSWMASVVKEVQEKRLEVKGNGSPKVS